MGGRERDARRAGDQQHHGVRAARLSPRGTRCGRVKAMPASLIEDLLHRRGDHRGEAPGAGSRRPRRRAARARSAHWPGRAPGTTSRASGRASTGIVPARCGTARRRRAIGRRERRGRAPRRARRSGPGRRRRRVHTGQSESAAASARSGPMPAGSPVVTIDPPRRSGIPDLDVGLVAESSQPQLGLLVELALAQRASARAAGALRRSGRACACRAAARCASRTGCGTAR